MNASVNRVIYLGDDTAYFRVLSAEIKRLQGGTPVKLEQIFESTPKRIQGLLPKVMEMNASIILVDFSKETDDYGHLARLLVRTNTVKPFVLMGLHDYLSPSDQVKESFLSGMQMNFIKSAEVFDPAFAILCILSSGKREHGFANAKLSKEIQAYHLCKIGFIDDHSLHFETDLNLSPGALLHLHSHWNREKIVPSTILKTRQTSSQLLFYHYKNGVDADFQWIDPLVFPEGESHERIQELNGERDHNINKAKKNLKTWLENNIDRSQNKSVRVLVVDRAYNFYQDRERTDKYGYAIRCQPFLNDAVAEIQAQCPQVIAFALDGAPDPKKKEITGPPNDMATLRNIAQHCKKAFPDHPPYLVAFNVVGMNSKDLQQQLGYEHAMAYSGELGPEVLLKMAGLFSDKIRLAHEKAKTPADHKAKESLVVFIKKSNPISIGEIEETIKFVQLSESDAVIHCERELAPGTVLHFRFPIEGYLTITQHATHSKAPLHYALINGVGEIGKKELRVYVNEQFFKDHDAAKLVELEAFQKVHQAKLQARLDQEAKELAAQEAAEAEAAAKAKAEAEAAAAQPSPTPDEKKVANG